VEDTGRCHSTALGDKAARKIGIAAGKKQCHTISTATLSQQDAISCAPYFMAVTDFPMTNIKATRTDGVKPLRERAWVGTRVDRISLCGAPNEKGCGIEDPEAIEGGIKVATLLRQLNTTGYAGDITADLLVTYRRRERKWTPPVASRGIETALRDPEGAAPWIVARNYADFASELH
jgi:hypothetical protein